MALPDFLIAGVPKAGTSALHAALAPHPWLHLSAVKEPKFFLTDGPPPRRGGPGDVQTYQEHVWRRADYEALFDGAPPGALRGESTPFYLHDRAAHARIARLLPDELTDAPARTVLPGDHTIGVKDPVVYLDGDRWHLWASCHPLESDEHADRMSTWHATSPDGLAWQWQGVALSGRPGTWDARGVRVSAVLPTADGLVATYDGRACAQENWEERTGVATGTFDTLVAADGEPVTSPHAPGGLRYLSLVTMPDGRHRIYYEMTREDGAHELRTELI